MSIQVSDSGTLSTTTLITDQLQPGTGGRVVAAARGFRVTCHSSGAPMRCTGLVAVRPAHNTSGASSTTASGPVTSVRPWRRDTTDIGWRPDASTSSMAACSKRSSSSPTGSSTRVMPATDAVPGMMHTWSAV